MAKLEMHRSRLATLKKTNQKLPQIKTWGRGRGGRAWRKLREQIILRDKQICQHCGLLALEPEVDHIVPLAAGGTDAPGNLQVLCKSPCHADKTARESRGDFS
ncbi:hypothetical protein AKN92_11480 [Thiopseudomonas alkaliphila]|nr:hypothetical protein AKN92_11480 [Thiopseudomonas alkaliphila]